MSLGDATPAWQGFARSAPPISSDALIDVSRPSHMSSGDWSRYERALLRPLAELVRRLSPSVIGISGPPGSGKSTLVGLLAAVLGSPESKPLALSLDDFYLPRRERISRGLEWRAGPGSHDLPLIVETLERIRARRAPIKVPRFSGHADDRVDAETLSAVPSLVLLEGWLLGYPDEGYGDILEYLDLLVFLDVAVATAKARRFEREHALREAGGGFSPGDMQQFWDEVLEPGISRLVPAAKRSADLVLEMDSAQRVHSVEVRSDVVAATLLKKANSLGSKEGGPTP